MNLGSKHRSLALLAIGVTGPRAFTRERMKVLLLGCGEGCGIAGGY
jgi:hypothetical protein